MSETSNTSVLPSAIGPAAMGPTAEGPTAERPPPPRPRHTLRQLGSPLLQLEDDFIAQPLTDSGVEIDHAPNTLGAVYNRVRQLVRTHKLDLDRIGFGETGLVVTFANQRHAALFKLFWID